MFSIMLAAIVIYAIVRLYEKRGKEPPKVMFWIVVALALLAGVIATSEHGCRSEYIL